jgi:hypothetical protein
MLVGHLPFLGRLASFLLSGDPEAGVVRFRNAGIVCLSDQEGKWAVNWVMPSDLVKRTMVETSCCGSPVYRQSWNCALCAYGYTRQWTTMGSPDHCPWLPSPSRRMSPRLLRGCRHRRAAFRTSRSHWTLHLSTPPEPPGSSPPQPPGSSDGASVPSNQAATAAATYANTERPC